MSLPSSSRWDHEVRLLAWLASCICIFSFLFYFRSGELLLYGDAVAHINIARRVFDSRTPGLLQLGTVWLPLPHLLMIPFLIFDRMWRSGVGGSMPSLAAYVFGVVGMFRLLRAVLWRGDESAQGAARVAAWFAAAIYAANPSLIYMQTTAMGESLYLAFFIWTVVYFREFVQGEAQALTKCGLCLSAACLTRYDGWFLAAPIVVAVAMFHLSREHKLGTTENAVPPLQTTQSLKPQHTWTLTKFVLIAGAAPAFWLAYNAAIYRNPLEFANGPYSAKAVEQKTGTINTANGNLYAGAMYFLKAAVLDVADPTWLGRLWLLLAVAGAVAIPAFARGAWPLLLLWTPLPFYALSLAYGHVPIFVPAWWPFSQYNLRYGLELLPAIAASMGVLFAEIWKWGWPRLVLRYAAILAIVGVVIAGYVWAWRAGPASYSEAAINSRGRIALERQVANWLKDLPPNSTLLMYLGEHPGAAQEAGIPLKRVINEGNHRVWKQPVDPEGLWERALANPSELADYALAFDGDPVWNAVHARHFPELVEINVTGQRRAILYRTR